MICCGGRKKKVWLCETSLGSVTTAFIPAVSGVAIIWRIEINPSGLVTIQLDYCGLTNNIVLFCSLSESCALCHHVYIHFTLLVCQSSLYQRSGKMSGSSCGTLGMLAGHSISSDSMLQMESKNRRKRMMPRKYRRRKNLCSKIMDIHRGGQCKCEILGVKAVLSCQNDNLTVMIVSHFK